MPVIERAPKHILHIVDRMACGGVETWLMHALRTIDRNRVRMDFLVHTKEPAVYDNEIQTRGSRIFRIASSYRSPGYSANIAKLLRDEGPFDAVHSHVHHFSGVLLWLAKRAGVPVRIAHSHSDTSRKDETSGFGRTIYLRSTERAISRYATHLAAASRGAGQSLFGSSWNSDSRRRLIHCGIDLAAFHAAADRESVRKSLGVRASDFVIGHTGRFCTPKNHRFLVEVTAKVACVRPGLRLLLVGDGPDRAAIEQAVQAAGLGDRTIFTGIRPDVFNLLQAMDVFVFPSLWEGLPLTVLEAQAAGLPCVLSDIITEETDVIAGLVRRVPLGSAAEWSCAVLAAAETRRSDRLAAIAAIERNGFNIHRSVETLYAIYSA